MATKFVDAVRTCLKTGGYATTKDGADQGGTFLVGVAGRLYAIHNDFQIARAADGYDAVGCGDDLALGSLFSTKDSDDPRKRLRLALSAAAHHSAGVSAPFKIVSQKRTP